MAPGDATTSPAPSSGRRERKKAATRESISTAALELFLERGFDAVSIREIAERADVAVATVFAHFSGKEALVFDEDAEVEHSLVAAVARRPPGIDALTALEDWFLASRAAQSGPNRDPAFDAFQRLVDATPVLREYWRTMWRRYEPRLAEALTESAALDEPLGHLIAALAIEGYLRAVNDEHPSDTIRLLFRLLRSGTTPSAQAPQPDFHCTAD